MCVYSLQILSATDSEEDRTGISTRTHRVCVLGATGCIGFELTAHLLRHNTEVLAIVRNEEKLQEMLTNRGIAYPNAELSVHSLDLFGGDELNGDLQQTIGNCNYIFNVASKPLSWNPFSRINREWGSAVSLLTRKLVEIASSSTVRPHIFAFCGPEYFDNYDENIGRFNKMLTKFLNSLISGLRDNHDEAMLLLASDYDKWSVMRCGSIRPGSGGFGDASKIDTDPHRDRSDYRRGRGCALVAEDLAAYIADRMHKGLISEFEGKMPFLFNTQF